MILWLIIYAAPPALLTNIDIPWDNEMLTDWGAEAGYTKLLLIGCADSKSETKNSASHSFVLCWDTVHIGTIPFHFTSLFWCSNKFCYLRLNIIMF